MKRFQLGVALTFVLAATVPTSARDIIHDAEYYILAAQHGEEWKADDRRIDAKLAEVRRHNGGKPPNIVYILLDDVGSPPTSCTSCSTTWGSGKSGRRS